jgi:hypothetical protein
MYIIHRYTYILVCMYTYRYIYTRVSMYATSKSACTPPSYIYIYTHTQMYIYVYVYVYICIYICAYMYTYMYIHAYVCICIYIHIHIYIYIYTYTHTHTHIYIYIYTYVCMYIRTYVCMYVSAQIYTHTVGLYPFPWDHQMKLSVRLLVALDNRQTDTLCSLCERPECRSRQQTDRHLASQIPLTNTRSTIAPSRQHQHTPWFSNWNSKSFLNLTPMSFPESPLLILSSR